MKKYTVKTEVTPEIKMALMEISRVEKRSMRKQLEYIIEDYIAQRSNQLSLSSGVALNKAYYGDNYAENDNS